ncbi:hypothetical protein ACFWWA_33830, partial [Streptomyces goshikiensis]
MYTELVALLRATLPEFLGSLSAALAVTAGGWTVRRVRDRTTPASERRPGETDPPPARPQGSLTQVDPAHPQSRCAESDRFLNALFHWMVSCHADQLNPNPPSLENTMGLSAKGEPVIVRDETTVDVGIHLQE